jgi:hypothetical protein
MSTFIGRGARLPRPMFSPRRNLPLSRTHPASSPRRFYRNADEIDLQRCGNTQLDEIVQIRKRVWTGSSNIETDCASIFSMALLSDHMAQSLLI